METFILDQELQELHIQEELVEQHLIKQMEKMEQQMEEPEDIHLAMEVELETHIMELEVC